MINRIIGNRIRQERERLGLKQQDLAHALRVSPQAVSKWERGENAPDISLLVPLARLLGVTTDALLGYTAPGTDILEASVVCFRMLGYSRKSRELSLKELTLWVNGFFHQTTEAVLQYSGIPVEYAGDNFLSFFTGPDHSRLAVEAARCAGKIVKDPWLAAVNSGTIYLGSIGHRDYAAPNIMGNTVNLVFMLLDWMEKREKNTIALLDHVLDKEDIRVETQPIDDVLFSGLTEKITVHRIMDEKEKNNEI